MPYLNGSRPLNERRLRARTRALIVSGDVLSRIEIRLLLEMHGYQVEEVGDGMEAVGLLDLDAPPLDLVVLDYHMTLLNGLETLQALRALQPGLKALLCVGPGEEVRAPVLPERVALLKTPCTMHTLCEVLDKVYGITRHNLGHGRVASSHRVKFAGHLPHYPPR
jgi:two-component system, cell cycle sensor histidine kinase and response regulator CckA